MWNRVRKSPILETYGFCTEKINSFFHHLFGPLKQQTIRLSVDITLQLWPYTTVVSQWFLKHVNFTITPSVSSFLHSTFMNTKEM